MKWIVMGEEKGYIKLVSKSGTPGLLPKGSYLTVEENQTKFILRVEISNQYEPYAPSPLVVDMGLSPINADRKSQNIIFAARVRDLTIRGDGLIDFIPPQSMARRSTQEEIDLALDNRGKGPKVMLSTIQANTSQILFDENKNPIVVNLPEDLFYHQILICGKTGSGKTVASKYLAQYFVEKMKGAVLAVNVKDTDFLHMNKASKTDNPAIQSEWRSLDLTPRPIFNYTIYFPANIPFSSAPGISKEYCKKITMNIDDIDPEAMSGLVRGISDLGAQQLPSIFRYWKYNNKKNHEYSFKGFVNYFSNGNNDERRFKTMNVREETGPEIQLHSGTYHNILRSLTYAMDFFDNDEAENLKAEDILFPGKMSVINLAGSKGIDFGSVLLRHLLHKIVEIKARKESQVPILLIIDEVHQFYNNEASKEALGDLDTICRTGRSSEIGVIFSSQNPTDIPSGLTNVINTKIFFKTDNLTGKKYGISFSDEELENLKTGFSAVSLHNLNQVKSIKWPLALSGVFEKGDKND